MNIAGQVSFMFHKTSSQELDATMRSLGAIPKSTPIPRPGWHYPSSENPLLDFHLIEDVRDYAKDLVWESWQWFIPLLRALGAREENALIVDVVVRDDASVLKNLRTFVLKLLENHPGVVRDSVTEKAWCREEIANNSFKDGRTFFGKGQ